MTDHPINAVVLDGSDVDKAAFRSYDKTRHRLRVLSIAEVTSSDFSDAFGIDFNGILYDKNTIDTTTVHDGISCLVDNVGTRFKAVSASAQLSVFIPARHMISRTTNGAADGSVETTTNKRMLVTKNFDASTAEYVQFDLRVPDAWEGGAITFQPVWSHPSTTTNFGVVWSLAAISIANDDAADVAFGTEQVVADAGGTTDDIYIGPASSALTVGGTPVAGGLATFQVGRVPSNGSDTLAVDARLHGIFVRFVLPVPPPPLLDFSQALNSQYLGAL